MYHAIVDDLIVANPSLRLENKEDKIFAVSVNVYMIENNYETQAKTRENTLTNKSAPTRRRYSGRIRPHINFISSRLLASYVLVRFRCAFIPSNSTLAWLALRLASTIF